MYTEPMEVIPAINAQSFDEVKKLIAQASAFAPWIHIDVTDGIFTPHQTWNNAEELKQLIIDNPVLTTVNFELHLMVKNPELVIGAWLRTGVKRLIVHVETISDEEVITDHCREHAVEVMLAAGPEIGIDQLLQYKKEFKAFQLLAVSPGKAGQTFDEMTIEKISGLRKELPEAVIEVDGGINQETAKRCKNAGADIVVSASHIFGSADPKKAFEDLQVSVA